MSIRVVLGPVAPVHKIDSQMIADKFLPKVDSSEALLNEPLGWRSTAVLSVPEASENLDHT